MGFYIDHFVSEEEFAKLKREGHVSFLAAFSQDGENTFVKIDITRFQTPEEFIYSASRIEKGVNKGPRSKLVKAARSKRKN